MTSPSRHDSTRDGSNQPGDSLGADLEDRAVARLSDEEVLAMLERSTPGPWRWLGPDVLAADYGPRSTVLAGDDVRCTDWKTGTLAVFRRDSADARLMAAAPDLAGEVLALRAERDCLRAEVLETRADRAMARAEVARQAIVFAVERGDVSAIPYDGWTNRQPDFMRPWFDKQGVSVRPLYTDRPGLTDERDMVGWSAWIPTETQTDDGRPRAMQIVSAKTALDCIDKVEAIWKRRKAADAALDDGGEA